ncbi:MAG: hypothetical protein RLZZ337_854 [Bacteroidota bacterium]
MKKLLVFSLFMSFFLQGYSQIKQFSTRVYFETASSKLDSNSILKLGQVVDSLKTYESYRIYLRGNTDSIGDSAYNHTLSENRLRIVQYYLVDHGIADSIFKAEALGEEKPIADNETEEGKQRNRRVDIMVKYKEKVAIDSNDLLPSIWELYKKTERKPQEFCIDNSRDTFVRCEQGTLIKIKANTFRQSRKCKEECVTFEVSEDFLQSDMILDNLATTSNGRMIETQGMVYLNAKDCKGNDLKITRGSDLLIFQPTDTIIDNAKIFTGNRTGHDSDMNWTVNNTSVLSGFTMETVQTCNYWICGGVRRGGCDCPFFMCRIRNLDDVVWGVFVPCSRYDNRMFRKEIRVCRVNNRLAYARSRENKKWEARLEKKLERKENRRQKLIDKYAERCGLLPSGFQLADIPNPCKRLYELFEQYGVDNYKDLFYQLNKEQMDKFGVDNMQDLQDSLATATRRGIEENYKSKNLAFDDIKYYVYNTTRFGWGNVDVFADVKPKDMVTMSVNINAYKNTDCKLVFRDRRFVIPAETEAGIYQFKNMPKGERVWIVTLMYANGQPFLSMEETVIDDGVHSVNYESLTLEELKEKLKLLDMP